VESRCCWSPACGFCESIAQELAGLEGDLQKHDVQLVLLAHEGAESNRKLAEEHGLKSPILLLNDSQPPAPFQNMGTPVAYLLDGKGRVAQTCAVGAEEVPKLARNPAAGAKRLPGDKPLSESRIVRDGLKAGTPAPGFRLPDLNGGTVSLDDYRGRRVLLVFSDPHSGPCDALAPELAKLHRKHKNNGLEFLMIGRGEAGENRRKAKESGITVSGGFAGDVETVEGVRDLRHASRVPGWGRWHHLAGRGRGGGRHHGIGP